MASLQLKAVRGVLGLLRQVVTSRSGTSEMSLAARRTRYKKVLGLFGSGPRAELRKSAVGGVPGLWVTAPGADPGRVVLYLHGGGYVLGSHRTHWPLASRVSRATGFRVFLPDYRLAPEHPFPAAVEDATRSYCALLEARFASERIAVVGDSAGGGLAIALLVRLRDEGKPLPGACACMSPWVDLALTGDSILARAGQDPIIRRPDLKVVASAYLGGADPMTPLASPLYAGLSGLPPLLIQVGTAEVLLDDGLRLAKRASECGVEVTLDVWEDMVHTWQMLAGILPEGRRAIAELGAFIAEKLQRVRR